MIRIMPFVGLYRIRSDDRLLIALPCLPVQRYNVFTSIVVMKNRSIKTRRMQIYRFTPWSRSLISHSPLRFFRVWNLSTKKTFTASFRIKMPFMSAETLPWSPLSPTKQSFNMQKWFMISKSSRNAFPKNRKIPALINARILSFLIYMTGSLWKIWLPKQTVIPTTSPNYSDYSYIEIATYLGFSS